MSGRSRSFIFAAAPFLIVMLVLGILNCFERNRISSSFAMPSRGGAWRCNTKIKPSQETMRVTFAFGMTRTARVMRFCEFFLRYRDPFERRQVRFRETS